MATNVIDFQIERGKRLLSEIVQHEAMAASYRREILERWAEYGAILRDLRQLHPSNADFGRAIRENGLDAAPAQSASTRSDAMWLAQLDESHFATVVAKQDPPSSHPAHARKWARAQGYAWASNKPGSDGRTREAKGAVKLLEEAGLVSASSSAKARAQVRAQVVKEAQLPEAALHGTLAPEHRAPFAEAVERVQDRKHGVTVAAIREELPESARERFDRALKKALDIKARELNESYQKSYWQAVTAEVERRLPEHAANEIARISAVNRTLEELADVWRLRAEACKDMIRLFNANFRPITAALHPDRAPPERHEQFTRAMETVNRIKAAIDRTAWEKW